MQSSRSELDLKTACFIFYMKNCFSSIVEDFKNHQWKSTEMKFVRFMQTKYIYDNFKKIMV